MRNIDSQTTLASIGFHCMDTKQTKRFLKIYSLLFQSRKSHQQGLNNMGVNKCWQYFHWCVNYPFKAYIFITVCVSRESKSNQQPLMQHTTKRATPTLIHLTNCYIQPLSHNQRFFKRACKHKMVTFYISVETQTNSIAGV